LNEARRASFAEFARRAPCLPCSFLKRRSNRHRIQSSLFVRGSGGRILPAPRPPRVGVFGGVRRTLSSLDREEAHVHLHPLPFFSRRSFARRRFTAFLPCRRSTKNLLVCFLFDFSFSLIFCFFLLPSSVSLVRISPPPFSCLDLQIGKHQRERALHCPHFRLTFIDPPPQPS